MKRVLLPIFAAGFILGLCALPANAIVLQWEPTGAMVTAREFHSATLLGNGKVLIAGGDYGNYFSSAELYAPGPGTFTSTGAMRVARTQHTATLLDNGKVLITGGANSSGYLSTAELYDPGTGTFTYTGAMRTSRYGHSATLLGNGKVLIAGGWGNSFGYNSSAELFDPSTGTFTYTGTMGAGRMHHTATLLGNGKVLIAGGEDASGALSSAELYDPTTGTFTPTGAMGARRTLYTATLLGNGKVLVAGGVSTSYLSSAEVYDPSTGTFTPTGAMGAARYGHTATLLENGKALIAGGQYEMTTLSSAELYDPGTGMFTPTETMGIGRVYHTATLLGNGKVLVAGVGYRNLPPSAELYGPVSLPVAEAGPDQSAHPGTPVSLDGSGSTDSGGWYPLAYAWSLVSTPPGSSAFLVNPNSSTPSFTPDLWGDYTVQLVVTNSRGMLSEPDSIKVSTINAAPVADAGPDQSVTLIGSKVDLNGGGSYDLDGDPLAYSWSIISKPVGSVADLSSTTSPTPYFFADVHGDYKIQLFVSDPWVSGSDTVKVSFTNVAPVANAGTNQAVTAGATVTLDGSASMDANSDLLSFTWALASLPAGSTAVLSNPFAVKPTFVADVAGSYVVSLVVNDGFVDSFPSNVTITATTTSLYVIEILRKAIVTINGSDDKYFKNPNMKNALTNKINVVIMDVQNGFYLDALLKLQNDIIKKMAGCAASGQPDKTDWIIACIAQAQPYALLQQAYDLLWDM